MKIYVVITFLFCVGSLTPAQDKSFFNDIKVNGFFSGSYNYNFNNPPDNKIRFRVFDYANNSFKIDVFELSARKDANNAGDAGFRFDLTTGSSIPAITRSFGLTSGDIDFHQLFVSYIAPLGNGVKLDIGKFITPFGFEVIEGYDGYNDNYSHSYNFGYSIPYTHTGIKASYNFSEAAKLAILVVNGWDNAVENNKSKSIGIQLNLTPLAGLNIIPGFIYGPEKTNNNHDNRALFDFVTTYSISEPFTAGIDFDYGREPNSPYYNETAEWLGLAGYLKYKISGKYSIALRGEEFDDRSGLRTGTTQRLTELTLTPSVNINNNLIFRCDLRYDKSDVKSFTDKDNFPIDTQITVGLNLIYFF
jgi:Putative beta-barrel porin-2, OmpL-like. bbp2